MLKRFIIGVFAAVTCAVSIITPTFRSHADSVEWDGKSEIKDGVVYTVTRELTVNGAVTVPKNAKLHVLADGSLKLTPKSKITVRGDFGVFKGATVLLSGELAVRPTGSLLVHGTLLASVSSVMNVNANMNIYADGVFKSSGVFKLYSERTLTNKGAFTLLKSGSVTVSGKIANAKNARFDVQGNLSVTKNGAVVNSGAITVSANAAVRNSGLFTLEKASKFNLAGEFKNTKSGKLDDRRTGVNYDALTAFALTNEPDVEIYGIDVSRYQRDVDWEKVASSGVDFVMLRAAVGAVNGAPVAADSKFAEHFAGAREAGLEIGVYMYSYAKTVSEIKTEAKFLVKLLKDYKITYPVALDMEELRGYYTDDPSKMAEAFFTIVMDAGYYPIMYSYKSWLENLLDASVRDKYAVWVAHTGVNATTYAGNYYMWQYSHTGRISGINGDVDLNISYRDFAAFIKKNRLNNL